MRWLATGLTGFIGRYLAEELGRLQHVDLTVIVRPRSMASADGFLRKLSFTRLNIVQSSLADPYCVRLPHSDYDVVVNLVGPQRNSPDAQWQANVEYVQRLVLLLSSITVRRAIHLSSAAVYGLPRGTAVFTEAEIPRPTNWYGVTKLMGEQIMLRFHIDTGTPVTILRPSWVVGDRSRLLDKHLVAAYRRGVRIIIPLATPANVIYVRDVARAIVLAAHGAREGFEIFNLNSSDRIRFREFLEVLDREVRRSKVPVLVPVPLVRILSRKFNFLRGLLADVYYDPTRAREEIGFVPRYGAASMVKEVLARIENPCAALEEKL